MLKKFIKNENSFNSKDKTRINDMIRVPKVMLVDGDKNLGVFSTDAAKKIARDQNLDLVEVSPMANPPVCKIMDYSKFKYEKSIKQKEKNKSQKALSEKEIRLSPSIGDHDLNVKINAAKKFLTSGLKVKFNLKYEKRENAHKELGYNVLQKIKEALSEVSSVEIDPKLEGNNLNCVLIPKKTA
jgi:translation initiation factor IF-3